MEKKTNFLTEKELIEKLSLSRTTIHRMKKEGLPCVIVGKNRYRYQEEDVIKWISKHWQIPYHEKIKEMDDQNRPINEYITVQELMSYYKISRTTIYRLTKEGMPSLKLKNNRLFFHPDDVEIWVKEQSEIKQSKKESS